MTLEHGSYGAYQKGCRCGACTHASAEYHREYKRRRREAAVPFIPVDVRRSDKPREWMLRANCRGADPELFHPQRGDMRSVKEAKAICRRCEVKAECLADAHTAPIEPLGIRGGYGEEERRVMRRKARLGQSA